MQAIYRYDLATSFPPDREETTYAELATVTGLPDNHIKRVLRCAMTYHIFREPRKGVVAHTAVSKLLADDALVTEWVGMVSEEIWPAVSKVLSFESYYPRALDADFIKKAVEALRQWPRSEEPNHSVSCAMLLFSELQLKV